MCRQDKTLYNTPKYRFVVRFTNQKVIAQVAYATIMGDKIIAAADSSELTRYGLPVGQKNYAAAYATGLLCARRVLKQLGMDQMMVGVEEADGEEFHIEEDDFERRPFKCVLDIGLVHTTTGHRVFGALKGAIDGGLYIPHSVKRFPGYTKEEGAEANYDAGVHRHRIFAQHVADYMKLMEEEEHDKYEKHFALYIKNKISADNLEETIKKVHAAIRANPDRVKKSAKPAYKAVRDGNIIKVKGKDGAEVQYLRCVRLTREQRKERVQLKLQKVAEMLSAAAQDE